jgi:hypothetical protein
LSGFSADWQAGLTAETVKVDKKHPCCVVCGRRFSKVERSVDVKNVCVDCLRRMGE